METIIDWLRRAEAQLDEWGKPAWIAVMVLGFVMVWPLGLAILIYMLWSNRMGCNHRHNRKWGRRKARRATGNAAFDAYRDETLRRLEEEQSEFEDFLERLRQARDKSEFDQFMSDRSRPESDDAQPAG